MTLEDVYKIMVQLLAQSEGIKEALVEKEKRNEDRWDRLCEQSDRIEERWNDIADLLADDNRHILDKIEEAKKEVVDAIPKPE